MQSLAIGRRPKRNLAVVPYSVLVVALALLAAPCALIFSRTASQRFAIPAAAARAATLRTPKTVLWAWERREDLRFIDPKKDGVAFLASTIELRSIRPGSDSERDAGVTVKPRLQPLRIPDGTRLTAVVRIESSNDLWHRADALGEARATTLYSDFQRARVAALASGAARLPRVSELQIDFDASQSERPFYAGLLADVRKRLPPGMTLSITALASWCVGDTWLDRLAPGTIDDAVPMLFRMRPDGAEIESDVESGKDFRSPICRASVGVSTDESFSRKLLLGVAQSRWRTKRVYLFSPKPWTKEAVDTVAQEMKPWHED